MSTMYYTVPDNRQIGQVHSLGRDKGYHFTWSMLPLEFCEFATNALYNPAIMDEYGHEFSMNWFTEIVKNARSQSFDERIE